MKKVLLSMIAVVAMASCTKESQPENNCDCGEVTRVDYYHVVDTTNTDLYLDYYDFKVLNNCTGLSSEYTTRFDNPFNDYVIPVLGETICK